MVKNIGMMDVDDCKKCCMYACSNRGKQHKTAHCDSFMEQQLLENNLREGLKQGEADWLYKLCNKVVLIE